MGEFEYFWATRVQVVIDEKMDLLPEAQASQLERLRTRDWEETSWSTSPELPHGAIAGYDSATVG